MLGLGTTLIISNKEMDDIMKIVNNWKWRKRFLGMLLGTLAVSLLGSALAGKGVKLIEEIDSNES